MSLTGVFQGHHTMFKINSLKILLSNHLALYFANKGGGTHIGELELGICRKHYHYPVGSLPPTPPTLGLAN